MRVRTEEFPSSYVALASFAKALAHPARISIVSFLQERGEATCGDIVSSLPLKQPTVSRHLKELREAGLVKHRFDGATTWYSLQRERMVSYCGVFQETLQSLPKQHKMMEIPRFLHAFVFSVPTS